MSHLHIPDGLLPVWLWGSGLVVVVALLAMGRSPAPQRIAYQGALGALMLAANALPLGPLEYHLTLVGPVGILLGPRGAFQAAFVVGTILALLGHGGITTVGLNSLVLGAAAAVAFPAYRWLSRRMQPRWAMALGTTIGQATAGGLWLVMMAVALRFSGAPDAQPVGRLGIIAAFAFPLWLIGVAAESAVAWGIGQFLERVHPALLPGGLPAPAAGARPT